MKNKIIGVVSFLLCLTLGAVIGINIYKRNRPPRIKEVPYEVIREVIKEIPRVEIKEVYDFTQEPQVIETYLNLYNMIAVNNADLKFLVERAKMNQQLLQDTCDKCKAVIKTECPVCTACPDRGRRK